MLPVTKGQKPPQIKTISVKKWLSGVNTAYDDGRTPADGLRSGGNIMLDQDGTVKPRPSLVSYGPQPLGTVLGEIFPFRALDGLDFTNWNICLQNVDGTVNAYIAKGGDDTWTLCSGKTYSTDASAHFLQIQDKVLILTPTDTLSYLDIATSTIVDFTALSDAGAPTVANSGSTDITTGTKPYNIYYAVTANSKVGETQGTSTTTAITTQRDLWDPTKNALKVTWSAVTNAESYNLYAGIAADGAGTPQLYAIATGLDKNSTTFIDDGSRGLQLIRPLPSFNSTAGPKVSRGCIINGRVWLVGDADHPYYVRNGGDFGFELDFSPSNGGGFSVVGNGTEELPSVVMPYRDGRGNFEVTVLAQGTSGYGKRYLLSPDSVTYGSETISFYDVTEDNGRDGTDSPDGVILYNDSLWYPSRDGFKTTGTKPQLQNILSTDRVSNTIQPDISNLNNASMGKCVGLAFEGRLYWALPFSSTTNNQIWVLDLDRGGAWMKPWNISADWMWLYTDNDGVTHFLILFNNQIYELSTSQFTNDAGVSFSTSGNSGQITFSPDGRIWGHLLNVIYVLLRPQGPFQASVSGQGDSGAIAQVGSESFTPQTSVAGWDEPLFAWDTAGRSWDAITSVPSTLNSATQEVKVVVDQDLRWFSYGWNTSDFGVNYNLSDVIAEYVEIGIKDI